MTQYRDKPNGPKSTYTLWTVQTWSIYAGDILVRWYTEEERKHPTVVATACLVATKLMGRIESLKWTLGNVAKSSDVSETALWLEERALLERSNMEFPLQAWDHPNALPGPLQEQLLAYTKQGRRSLFTRTPR